MFICGTIFLSVYAEILAQEDAYEKFFRDADADDSGYLTIDELVTALRKGGYKGNEQQIRVRVTLRVSTIFIRINA